MVAFSLSWVEAIIVITIALSTTQTVLKIASKIETPLKIEPGH